MLTKFLRRIREGRVVTSVVANTKTKSGFLYAVTLPGQEPAMLRAKNQAEVKANVREAQGLTRLPAGTTVERVG